MRDELSNLLGPDEIAVDIYALNSKLSKNQFEKLENDKNKKKNVEKLFKKKMSKNISYLILSICNIIG